MTSRNSFPFTKRKGSKQLVFSNKESEAWVNTPRKTTKDLTHELLHKKVMKKSIGLP